MHPFTTFLFGQLFRLTHALEHCRAGMRGTQARKHNPMLNHPPAYIFAAFSSLSSTCNVLLLLRLFLPLVMFWHSTRTSCTVFSFLVVSLKQVPYQHTCAVLSCLILPWPKKIETGEKFISLRFQVHCSIMRCCAISTSMWGELATRRCQCVASMSKQSRFHTISHDRTIYLQLMDFSLSWFFWPG